MRSTHFVCADFKTKHSYFLLKKCETHLQCKRFSHCSDKNTVDLFIKATIEIFMSPPCKGWETYCFSPCVCVSVCL